MATWYCGIGGSDANSGATWALRKATITSLVAIAGIAAGDRLLVGPGVYREDVTLNDSGAAVATGGGTVTVTNESRIVTGAGTNFALAAAGQQFFIGNFATEVDGIGSGGVGFTTAASTPFQAGMEGYMIEIVGESIYIIDTVNSSSSIDLLNVNAGVGVALPGAGGGLTFYVVSGEGPYEIESIDTATQLTLVKPWSGPDLTGMLYEVYNPIYLIGDVTGIETDDIGGVVRLTGTDDDETRTRATGIDAASDDYWFIRGFQIDCFSNYGIYPDTCDYWTIEDCVFMDCQDFPIEFDDSLKTTVRRCIMLSGYFASGIYLFSNPAVANPQNMIENCYVDCGGSAAVISRTGGTTVKNLTSGFAPYSIIKTDNQTVGTGVFVHDCLLHHQASTVGTNAALYAAVAGQMIEQYNNLFSNAIDRTRVGTAANSLAYPHLPMLPLLTGRQRNPTTLFAPSQWDLTRYEGGLYPKNMDLYGVHNEVAQTRRSWGCTHAYATIRSTDQVQGTFTGSMYLEDAGEQQFVFPVRANWDYVVTVWVYLEANYAGNGPEMIVKQPGVASVVATSTLAIGSWEQLSASFTTGPEMDWMNVGLRSNNTSGLVNRGTYWQDLAVN